MEEIELGEEQEYEGVAKRTVSQGQGAYSCSSHPGN